MSNPLYVSTVKSNMGHLEAAAGAVGMMAAILALNHGEAPANALLKTLNEKVVASIGEVPIAFPTENVPLSRNSDKPLVVGVSSFGYSGTIAHIVLEEAPEVQRRANMEICTDVKRIQEEPMKRYESGRQAHRLLQQMTREEFSSSTIFTAHIHAGVLDEWVADHILHGEIVVPGAALLEMCCAAAMVVFGKAMDTTDAVVSVDGFRILVPLVANDVRSQSSAKASRIWCVIGDDGTASVYSDVSGERTLHADGEVRVMRRGEAEQSGSGCPNWDLLSQSAADADKRCTSSVDVDALYARYASSGLPYGPSFRLMRSGRMDSECKSTICSLSQGSDVMRTTTLLSPPLIDAVVQSVGSLSTAGADGSDSSLEDNRPMTLVPFSFDRVWLRPGVTDSVWSPGECIGHVEVRSKTDDMMVSDCTLLGPSGEAVLRIEGLHLCATRSDGVAVEARRDTHSRSSALVAASLFTEEQVGEVVRHIVSSLLGEDDINVSAALIDQGLDSMGATELSSMLSSELGIRVLPTMLFSYPTVVDIIGHMCEELGITNATIEAVPARSTGGDESDLAIVGVACRYPGDVSSLSQLWSLMEGQTNTCREAPLSRWDTDALLAGLEGPPDASLESMRYGSFLSDEVVESFRSNMFGISDSEAKHMDATQRLLLDVSYEALADAGQSSLTDLKGSNTGVFIGASASSTNQQNICTLDAGSKCLSAYDATSANIAVAAGRISFVLGLEGPAITVDTACSSSLVAMHSARLSLSRGECDTAIVGGVNQLSASTSINAAKAGMLSTDGKCHSFDISANGYARGEGCGAFVVKRLSDAIRDGDGIYAVVRGSSVMQDGRSASLTAPSGRMQEKLIRTALRDAGVEPANVQYVQAHGTGTPLGDPIETGAIPLCMERAAK